MNGRPRLTIVPQALSSLKQKTRPVFGRAQTIAPNFGAHNAMGLSDLI